MFFDFKFFKSFSVLFLSFCLLALPALAQKRKEVSYCPALKTGIVVPYPPFSWTTQEALPISGFKTIPHGFYQEFLKKALAGVVMEGNPVNIVMFSSYEDAFNALTEGRIDLLPGVYYNADVAKFSKLVYPALYNNTFRALFKKGNVKPMSELKNLKGAVMKEEESYWYEMAPFVKNDIREIEVMDAKEAFLGLLSGDIDFILAGQIFGQSQIDRFALEEEVSFSKETFRNPNIFIAARKTGLCPAALKALEQQLKNFQENPSLFDEMVSVQSKQYKELFKNDPPLTVKEK